VLSPTTWAITLFYLFIMGYRAGIFFLVLGILLLLFFILGYLADENYYPACLGGMLLAAVGLVLALRHRPPPVQSERFQAWKKISGRKDRGKPE